MKRIEPSAWEEDWSGKGDGSLDEGAPSPLSGRAVCTASPWAWLTFTRRPRLLPEVALAARPSVLLLMTALLAGFCLAWTCWQSGDGAQPAQRSGLILLADNSSPKLDSTSAEAPASRLPAAPKGELDRRNADATGTLPPPPAPVPAPPAVPAPLPPLDLTPSVGPVVAAPPAVELPAENAYAVRDACRGDTPMMNSWKTLGLHTILAAALGAGLQTPPAARATEGPPAEPDKTTAIAKQLADLRDALRDIERTVKKECGDLRSDLDRTDGKVKASQVELERMRSELAALRLDVDGLRKQLPPVPTRESGYGPEARSEIEQLRRSVDLMRQDLEGLRRQLPVNRVSGFEPTVGTARVRLMNTFPAIMTIVVNGKAYDVNPGETRMTEPMPYGPFTYEVLGVRGPQTRTLTASDRPFTIEVFPR